MGLHISDTEFHVVVRENQVRDFEDTGIRLQDADNVALERNRFSHNELGLEATGTRHLRLIENLIVGSAGAEVLLKDTHGTLVTMNEFEKTFPPPPNPGPIPQDEQPESHMAGLLGTGNDHLAINGNTFEGFVLDSVGVFLTDSDALLIENNTFSSVPTGIRLEDNQTQSVGNELQGPEDPTAVGNVPIQPPIVRQNTFEDTDFAISTEGSTPQILHNTLTGGGPQAIWINDAAGGSVTGNQLESDQSTFVVIAESRHVTIQDNDLQSPFDLIVLTGSETSRVTSNTLEAGVLLLDGKGLRHFEHEIDETNMIDGRPVLYLRGAHDETITRDDVAQITLVDSHRATIQDVSFRGHTAPIHVLSSENVTIQDSVVRESYVGIWSMHSDGLRLVDNEIRDSTSAGAVVTDARSALVTGNRVRGAEAGLVFQQASDAVVENNRIRDNYVGILLIESSGLLVQHNEIRDQYAGAWVADSRDTSFRKNEVEANTYGITVEGWYLGDGGGHRIHENNIHGNQEAGVTSNSQHTLDARENWWGCIGGPGSPGCDTVSGNVDFSDHREDPVPDAGTH